MLMKIRMKPEGEPPQTVYRKLRDIKPNRTRTRHEITHTASIRYNKQKVIAYLINSEWVSYGEPQDQSSAEIRKE